MTDPRRRKNTAFCAALAALLLAPHLFTGMPDSPYPIFGPARVLSGDEPHYLILINSLLNDGDLDVSNNYAAIHAGRQDAGAFWGANRDLDHHTLILIDGRRVDWRNFYSFKDPKWVTGADGVRHPIPMNPGVEPPPGAPEYSTHQYGVAFLLAPVLYWFRGTTWLEPAALFCSGLAVVGAMLFYRMLLRCFTADDFTINAVTVVAFLGSPVWFYGRSLFLEGLLTCCAVGAYALALRKQWSFLPGLLVGVSIHLKPHLALIAVPLFADLLARREWRRAMWMALPIAVSVGLLLGLYAELYGSPLTPPQSFTLGNPLVGSAGQLFSPTVGLLLFCPIAALAFVCWPALVRRHGRPALVTGAGFVLFFLLMACYQGWHGSDGGACYGPRHLTPVLPLLLVGLVALPDMRLYKNVAGKTLTWALAAVSIVVNGFGVFCYSQFWGQNPYVKMLTLLWPW